jgi:hypothetical protein
MALVVFTLYLKTENLLMKYMLIFQEFEKKKKYNNERIEDKDSPYAKCVHYEYSVYYKVRIVILTCSLM